MTKYFVTTLICLVLIASIAWSEIVYVNCIIGDDVTGERGNPDMPFKTIQKGIDVAIDGDTVLVADCTYKGAGNKNLDFKGKAITVTSENGAESCIIDCEGNGRGFYFQSGETSESVVSGFTIINGYNNWGGGICCWPSSPTIQNNKIIGNSASSGGGIYCASSSPTIEGNEIIDNSATTGLDLTGGGIACWSSSPIIRNNKIIGNSAGGGGGIGLDNFSSATVQNNEIIGNWATIWGSGGICCDDSSSPTIINNTISGNESPFGYGAISCTSYSYPTVLNTILWENNPEEISVDGSSEIDITYSCIQGSWEGEGNIDADPLFVDPENGDYHLQAGSPCIDAGTPEGAPPDDIEGNPRDEFPDMGAYEYQGVGTGSINGTVTDVAGDPIKLALVIAVLGETKEKAFTDSEGYYEILNLKPSTYWVLCIKRNYKVGIRKAEVVAGGVTTVDFKLREKPD